MPDFDRTRSSLRLEIAISDSLDVREFNVDDGLNELFSVDLEVMSQNPALDFEELVGQPAAFHIDLDPAAYPDTPRRTWSGVVSEAHLLRSEPGGASTYQVTVSPHLWLLTRRTNCRVFQQKTDLAVVKELLGEWGIEPLDECSGSYKTRKYRVQYQETDFQFISRLLEATGVTYSFRAVEGQTQLVLSDAPERGPERAAQLEHTDSPVTNTRYATRLRASRAITAGRIAVADHDHRLPNAPLVAQTAASAHATESKLESFTYVPGLLRFGNPGPNDTPTADDRGRTRTDAGEGKRIADQLGAAAMARARRYMFESNALDLSPGLRLTVGQHPVAERAGQLLITRTTITGSHDSEGQVSVQTSAASSPYKPAMTTPTPVVHGIETATVVGPAGQELHCDEFGRVRVQFHWDRYGKMDEMSSCWVPVNQPWAGGGLGAINIPRIGQEVMVSFLAGSPEEPMIMGRMYTNLNRPPQPLPESITQNGFKSRTVHGGADEYNELWFEDKKGVEQFRVQAQKNYDKLVKNDESKTVNRDKSQVVGRNRKSAITGNDKEAVEGNQTQSVTGDQKNSVMGDKIASVLGNLLSMAGGERIMKTIGNMVSNALTHTIESSQGTTIKVGASTITITPEAIVLNSPKILLNPGDSVTQSASTTGATPTAGG